jgi:hypothetical protein
MGGLQPVQYGPVTVSAEARTLLWVKVHVCINSRHACRNHFIFTTVYPVVLIICPHLLPLALSSG